MLSVGFAESPKIPLCLVSYAECHFADCHCAKCRYAECHYAECRYAVCHYAQCRGENPTNIPRHSFHFLRGGQRPLLPCEVRYNETHQ